MVKLIKKENYLDYLSCPKNAWLKLHKPKLANFEIAEVERARFEEGNAVRLLAYKLFPEGVHVNNRRDAAAITKQFVEQKRTIFNSEHIYNDFVARIGILKFDDESNWHLYDVKAKTFKEDNSGKKQFEKEHLEELAYQIVILRNLDIDINRVFVTYLNPNYIYIDKIDIKEFLVHIDVTEEIFAIAEFTRFQMNKAQNTLLKKRESELICECIYKGRSSHCETFRYSYPRVPEYSIHDIAKIGLSKKKLKELVDGDIICMTDIPVDYDLTQIQRNQVYAYNFKQTIVNESIIEEELQKLEYPLYFLDYETYSPAVPLFDGFKPFQQIPFQFSLHILNSFDDEPIHVEYLHELDSDPSLALIQQLYRYIGSVGNIIVWHKSVEQKINAELGKRHLEFQEFFMGLNNRIYDLEKIFTKQLYVHPEFKGKTSIKNILPVLIPELIYDNLSINKGDVAPLRWYQMLYSSPSEIERLKIADDLREYCKLDTYGMYAIWRFLMNINDDLNNAGAFYRKTSKNFKQEPL